MAFVFSVNYPKSEAGPASIYRFKELLKTAGWVVKASGDGLSAYNASGDTITSGSSGANGYGNTSAWIRIQDPATVREFLIQRSTTDLLWTIKYSATAHFTGGSPSATVLPTATDSQSILTAAALFAAINSYRMHCAADNAAPYGFYLFNVPPGQGTGIYSYPSGVFVMDPMKSGSYPVEDVDPVVIVGDTTATSGFSPTLSGANVLGYLKKGLAGEGFVNIPWLKVSGRFDGGGGTDVRNGKFRAVPVMYARRAALTAPQGWKGLSSLFSYNPLPSHPGRTATRSSSKDLIAIGEFWLPWNGTDYLT